jgi:hypothetical protein
MAKTGKMTKTGEILFLNYMNSVKQHHIQAYTQNQYTSKATHSTESHKNPLSTSIQPTEPTKPTKNPIIKSHHKIINISHFTAHSPAQTKPKFSLNNLEISYHPNGLTQRIHSQNQSKNQPKR